MIIYYTRTGNSEAIAKEIAIINNMDIVHIEDHKVPSNRMAAFKAVLKRKSKLKEIPKLPSDEQIIVVAPIWVGSLPPAINSILPMLKKHPNVIYIASCMTVDGNEKFGPKIQKIIPNAKNVVLYQKLEMKDKLELVNKIL